MAIASVRVRIKGEWHILDYNSATGKYEKTITAPNVTSYNVNDGHYYPVTVEAINTAGTSATENDLSPTIGSSLRLRVLEKIKPTINITSPGEGAFITNNKQPIVFQVRDEVNGSGVNIDSLVLKLNGGTYNKSSNGMSVAKVTNGYDCVYTPPNTLHDGKHKVTIDVNDNDGNAATQQSRNYTVDTVPPVLNVTQPENGFITNQSTITIGGETNDATSSPVVVNIKVNGIDQGTVSLVDGIFAKTVTLVNGVNTIVVTSKDMANRETTVTIKGTLDTTKPVIQNVTLTPNPVDTGKTLVISVEVTG